MANVTVWTSGKTRHWWASWVRTHAIAFADFRAPGLNVYDPIQARYLDIVGTPAKLTNQYGRIGHTDTVALEGWRWPDSLWIPSNNISVYWHKRKTDTTNRQHYTWGTVLGGRFLCHAPWSDGKLYVDLGGTGAGQRYDFSGLSYSGNQTWGVSVGVDGFKAYTNGVQVASSATAATGRTPAAATFGISCSDLATGQGYTADLAEYAFLLILDDQSPPHVAQSLNSPQAVRHALFSRQRTYFLPGPNSGLTGPNSPVVWTSRTRKRTAPRNAVGINPSSPFARGLLYASWMPRLVDLVSGDPMSVSPSFTGSKYVDRMFPSFQLPAIAGNSSYWLAAHNLGVRPAWQIPSTSVTAMFPARFNTLGTAVDLGWYAAYSGSATYSGVGFRKQADDTLDVFIGTGSGGGSGSRRQRFSSSAVVANRDYILSLAYTNAGYPDLYIDGKLDNGSTSGTGASMGFTGVASGFCGIHSAGGVLYDGLYGGLFVWQGHKSAEWHAALTRHPFDFVKGSTRTYFIPSGKSASPVVTWRG